MVALMGGTAGARGSSTVADEPRPGKRSRETLSEIDFLLARETLREIDLFLAPSGGRKALARSAAAARARSTRRW
eukprot:scaffold107989_cov48-Phaeocystis_antarctica.AAC.2